MKKELFKVKAVISTAALLTVLSMSAFAQEVDFNKTGSLDWNQTLEIQKQIKDKQQKEKEKSALADIQSLKLTNKTSWRDSLEIQKKVEDKNNKIEQEKKEAKALADLPDFKKIGSLDWKDTLEIQDKVAKNQKVADKEKEQQIAIEIEAKDLTKVEDEKIVTEDITDAVADKVESITETETEEKEEGVISREEALERYICKKDSQFKALEEKFTSFEKTITESTLAMQNTIMQLGMMNQNQYQVYSVPSLTDQYSHMYPMMMMQSMQNQMMMQNLNYNYNNSINSLMMGQFMNYQNNIGQREDGNVTNNANTYNFNNLQETFNPDRTMAVVKGFEGQIQPNMNFTPSSQTSYNFDELVKETTTTTIDSPVDSTVETATTIDAATEAELAADLTAQGMS